MTRLGRYSLRFTSAYEAAANEMICKKTKGEAITDGRMLLLRTLRNAYPAPAESDKRFTSLARDEKLCIMLSKVATNHFSQNIKLSSKRQLRSPNRLQDLEAMLLIRIESSLRNAEQQRIHKVSGFTEWKHKLYGSYGTGKK